MEIIHDLSRKQFQTVADGKTAYVSYDLVDGCLNIEHTIVPREIEGRGIAAGGAYTIYKARRKAALCPINKGGNCTCLPVCDSLVGSESSIQR